MITDLTLNSKQLDALGRCITDIYEAEELQTCGLEVFHVHDEGGYMKASFTYECYGQVGEKVKPFLRSGSIYFTATIGDDYVQDFTEVRFPHEAV